MDLPKKKKKKTNFDWQKSCAMWKESVSTIQAANQLFQ